ncbi:23S rRNA (uridine(2552)-2'-O)-methyltransferase RlmE [Suttonella sp. R2A3]|uniref:23S rRNA (uridine(2552)-2'-O)-methyltransferase RlmE n=1 Tax=Suttonella sp. R2A3 TaxID=2908648 RepID=UPI001F1AE59D|nr:23S rRNA (uridine(2552)-2'-O)-methyltransferase RlmE [Suttonella sp. R2A3]UJF24667.1 23S rRNA (uridine(2552)-2'-O)-methyltransferase RlmE [Suttonella sp. R2A3]
MARSKSSHRWLKEHHNDKYVQQAREEGYRSRAVYKLKEIQAKDKLIKPGMTIVELGAAPGGWSQYAAECLQGRGHIFALDILPMDALPDVTFIQGDFREESVLAQLEDLIGENAGIDLVISDMAPNTSGIKSVDQAKSMYLVELAVDFALQHLQEHGNLLTKVFHGPGFDKLMRSLKNDFTQVLTRKPSASRQRSQETYLLAKGLIKR